MFEVDCFSYNRLKSYFVRLLCSRASLIHEVGYSFARCIMYLCLLLFSVLCCFGLWFPCVYYLYTAGCLSGFLFVYIFDLFIHQKKKKKRFLTCR